MPKRLYFFISLLLLFTACQTTHVARVQPQNYRLEAEASTATDAEVTALIAPYKQRLDAEMNQIIGESAEIMPKGSPESRLGNWFADLVHEQAEVYLGEPVDFAVLNSGGLRIPELPAGDISRGKIFELMPFENRLLALYLDASTVEQLVQHMAADGGWPVSAALRYEIVGNNAQEIRINGEPLKADKTYTVAIPDYVANGGSGSDFLIDTKRQDLNRLLRDAIFDYIEKQTKAGKKLKSKIDGRVVRLEN